MVNLYSFPTVLIALGLGLASAFNIELHFPEGQFQLQNPATGKCAVVLNDSNAWWAKVGTHACSCGNNHHYWKLSGNEIVSQGWTKQCMANWELSMWPVNYPGVTQCTCFNDKIHRWNFIPLEDGTFNLVTEVDGRCIQVGGWAEDTQLGFHDCDGADPMQKWRFYDECNFVNKQQIRSK